MNDIKSSKKSGTSTDAVVKAEKLFKTYQFLTWPDEFVQTREGKTTSPSEQKDDEGSVIGGSVICRDLSYVQVESKSTPDDETRPVRKKSTQKKVSRDTITDEME